MTRQEIMADLKSRNLFEVSGSRDPTWKAAFDLYFQETRTKLSQSCGSCYTRLRNWLKS